MGDQCSRCCETKDEKMNELVDGVAPTQHQKFDRGNQGIKNPPAKA